MTALTLVIGTLEYYNVEQEVIFAKKAWNE